MRPSIEMERMLRTLLRNQHKLMLAIADVSSADCTAARSFHHRQLRAAAAKMENTWDWILPETKAHPAID